jgi:two-component system nitrate/nitrite response regulator NarL
MLDVVVIADVRLHREGLAEVLDRHAGLAVVGAVESVAEAIALVAATAPQVAVVDLRQESGIACVRALTGAAPNLRVVALSLVEDPEVVIAWAEAGIAAYVSRDGSVAELVQAIEAAVRGELPCSARIAAALLDRVRALASVRLADRPAARLTKREREIVGLIDEGLANKEIASRLQIELPTVKNHVHNILEKLGASRRTEAVHRLHQQELTELHLYSGR